MKHRSALFKQSNCIHSAKRFVCKLREEIATKPKSLSASLVLTLWLFSGFARAQNYTITLYGQQNGVGSVIMTYTGSMLTNGQLNGSLVSDFRVNPAAMPWSSAPISADGQVGSLNPCNAFPDPGTGGPNGEANITCESAASGTTNGVPLFSFCFQGGSWPLAVGTYNVDSANQNVCGNYFVAYSQTGGFASASVNNGSIVVVKNTTWIVTSLADDGSPGTLRSVIANANSGDTITFSVSGTITLAQGPLETNKILTVSGPGAASLTISGNHAYTVFHIHSGAFINISGVTIQDGLGGVNGGDIDNEGVLTLSDCGVLASTPSNGNGGGLYNTGSANVLRCNFVGSPYFGTASDGGAIYNGGALTIASSSFSGFNVGGYGGALFNASGGTATLTNSTFWQNSANAGGAIMNSGNVTLVDSTIAGNGASGTGGAGIYTLNAPATLKNTLLANNIAGGVPTNCTVNGGGITSVGYNLSDDNSCVAYLNQTGDMNSTAAGLDPNGLQNNGGPTPTIAILPSSPAFNVIPLSPTNHCTAIDGTTPIANDQRGISRPQVSACDIGAFEYSSDNDSTYAALNGGNSFAGNQTITGSVNATNFVGNGSGLTAVNAATATTASGLNCAGCVGNPQLAINYAGSASQGGPASNALLFGGLAPSAFPTLSSNTFTGQQFMPALSVSSSSANAALTVQNSFATGIIAQGSDYGVYGRGPWGLYGYSTNPFGAGVQGSNTSGPGVTGESNNVGVYGVTFSGGVAGAFNATNGGKILSGQNNGAEVFSVANNGNVNTSGSLATSGPMTIGGGTPITEYVSTTDSLTIPALTPGSCTPFTTAALTGFTPGASDTIALGVPSSLVSGLGNGVFLLYQAWETTTNTSPTITIQACNPTGVKYKGGATGTIRVDVFKH